MRRELVVIASALALHPGCSFLVTFDEAKRPCAPDADGDGIGECLDGYACLIETCHAVGSKLRGDTCTLAAHCAAEDVCASFICRQGCTSPYENDPTACAPDANGQTTVCAGDFDFFDDRIAACLPGERASTCSARETFIKLFSDNTGLSDVGLCLKACAPDCTSFPCTDACVEPLREYRGVPPACQPVGLNAVLACLPAAPAAHPREQGEPCNLLDAPCSPGYACVASDSQQPGECRAYCSSDDPCSALDPNLTCEPKQNPGGTTVFHVCDDPPEY